MTNANEQTVVPATETMLSDGSAAPAKMTPMVSVDDKWLEAFYKECGREITLAYNTLNQMKNWAIVVAGAVVSGLAFSGSARTAQYPTLSIFIGTVIVYVFIIRFFVRAVVCYGNLLKWNKLQSDCVEIKLVRAYGTEN